jgi:hypothetical protein
MQGSRQEINMIKRIALILLSTSLCVAEPTQDPSDKDISPGMMILCAGIVAGESLTTEIVQNNALLKAGTIVEILGLGIAAAVLCIASSQALCKYSKLDVESAKKLGMIAGATLLIGAAGMSLGLSQIIIQDIKSCFFPR